jgi:hypothetical protein
VASFLALLEDRRQQALNRAVRLQGAVHRGNERDSGCGLGPLDLRDVLRRDADPIGERLKRQLRIRPAGAYLGAEPRRV